MSFSNWPFPAPVTDSALGPVIIAAFTVVAVATLLELLSPELRDLIAEELNGGELPEGWATRCLVLGIAIAPQAD